VCSKNLIVAFVIGLMVCVPAMADAPPDSVSVSGAVDHGGDWNAARLKADAGADFKSIDYSRRGQKHVGNAAPLLSLLKAAGIKTDLKMGPNVPPKQKNYALRLVVVVSGRDGYTATFSLAELLPDFGNHSVWLEVDEDGKALSERDLPMDLIVPDDVKPGRWVHGVGTITVLDASAATQPAVNPDH